MPNVYSDYSTPQADRYRKPFSNVYNTIVQLIVYFWVRRNVTVA